MRVTRAYWAASGPWSKSVDADLGSLTARVDELERQLALISGGGGGSGDGGSATSALTTDFADASFAVGSLEPMQMFTETTHVAGVKKGQIITVSPMADYTWLSVTGYAIQNDTVRVVVFNGGPIQVAPGNINVRISFLANA